MVASKYEIKVYGTNTGYLVSDSDSEVTETDVDALAGVVSVTIGCYTVNPFYNEDISIREGEGGVQVESTTQYNSYDIHIARFINANADYGDMTTFDNLMAVLRKNYKYLKVTDYKRSLHTADKVIKVVAPERTIDPTPARVDLTILFEKVKPNT